MKSVVGISTLLFDLTGGRTVYIEPGAKEQLNQGERRATRTPTLDGAAVVYDAGYAVADQTYLIQVRENTSYVGNWFAYLVKTYNLIRVTTSEGVFNAVPSRWYVEKGIATLETLITEQIA